MAPLALKKIPGVGPVSVTRLEGHGLVYCRDVIARGPDQLVEDLGSYGQWLYRKCRGIDEGRVGVSRTRKSIGHERTFGTDLRSQGEYLEVIENLCGRLAEDLSRKNVTGRTLTLKVKFADFKVITRSKTTGYRKDKSDLFAIAQELLLAEKLPPTTRVRLLGVSLSNLEVSNPHGVKMGRYFQPLLFPS